MDSRSNTLYVFGSLFLWCVRLGKYHRVIVFLMLHGIIDAYDDVRVEELGFDDSNPRTRLHKVMSFFIT